MPLTVVMPSLDCTGTVRAMSGAEGLPNVASLALVLSQDLREIPRRTSFLARRFCFDVREVRPKEAMTREWVSLVEEYSPALT